MTIDATVWAVIVQEEGNTGFLIDTVWKTEAMAHNRVQSPEFQSLINSEHVFVEELVVLDEEWVI